MGLDLLATLALVRRADLGSDLDTVSILDYLKPDGWLQMPSDGQSPIDEVMTLNIDGASHDGLSATIQGLDQKVLQIERAQKMLEPNGIWLRAQLKNETAARQAFLLRGKRGQLRVSSPAIGSNVLYQYPLGLTRGPFWEALAEVDVPDTPAGVSIHGGTIACDLTGDAPGRVAELTVIGSSGTFNRFWFGAKGTQYGVAPANFEPVWNLVSGGASYADVSAVVDATAVGGSNLTCTFATTTTMVNRAVVAVHQAVTYPADQRGSYLVLLRAKTSDASLSVNVRVGQGYTISGNYYSFTYQPLHPLTAANTGWMYYSLGFVQIPAVSGFNTLAIDNSALAIQAEKVSGSGNLLLDSIVLIPAEHCLHVQSTGLVTTQRTLFIGTQPGGRLSASVYAEAPDSAIVESMVPDAIDWSIPAGDSVIVCAADDTISGTAVAEEMTPALKVVPSYHSLRGAA